MSIPVSSMPRAAKSVKCSQGNVYRDKKHGIRNSYKTFGLLQLGYNLSLSIIIINSFTHLINSLISPSFLTRAWSS